MIQRTPQQRSQYELRLKAQRDERARMQFAVEQARAEAKAEGKAEGEAVGEARGRIKVLHEFLGQEQTSVENLSLDELATLEKDLQRRLHDRGV